MRPREQIKSLFAAVGYDYKLGKFNAIYNRAKEICQSADDKVSVRAMIQAC